MTELLPLILLGGLLTVEGTAAGQFMVSRPLVAGTLAGWLLGSPADGFAVGVLLEVYLLVAFPVGGARFPEGAPATVVAVYAAGLGGGGALAIGIAAGLVWGQIAGAAATGVRTLNARLVATGAELTPRSLELRHLGAVGLEGVRGCAVTAAGILTGSWAVRTFAAHWPLDEQATLGLLLLGGVVSLGILLRAFGGLRRRARFVASGLALGLLAGWLL